MSTCCLYVAFGAVLLGVDRIAGATMGAGTEAVADRRWRAARLTGWATFGLSVAIAGAVLLSPAGYRVVGPTGDVRYVQEPVFYLPLVVTLLICAFGPLAIVRKAGPPTPHFRIAAWFAAFAALSLLGVLREATVIPLSGSAELDLLITFGPIAVGTLCLLMSLRAARIT
jgi:hypothetical protein